MYITTYQSHITLSQCNLQTVVKRYLAKSLRHQAVDTLPLLSTGVTRINTEKVSGSGFKLNINTRSVNLELIQLKICRFCVSAHFKAKHELT